MTKKKDKKNPPKEILLDSPHNVDGVPVDEAVNTVNSQSEDVENPTINLNDYMYKEGQAIQVDGNLAFSIMSVLQEVWMKEVNVSFPVSTDGGIMTEEPIRTVSDFGAKAWVLVENLARAHINAINAGLAIKIDKDETE